jgi:hypothetical protein
MDASQSWLSVVEVSDESSPRLGCQGLSLSLQVVAISCSHNLFGGHHHGVTADDGNLLGKIMDV